MKISPHSTTISFREIISHFHVLNIQIDPVHRMPTDGMPFPISLLRPDRIWACHIVPLILRSHSRSKSYSQRVVCILHQAYHLAPNSSSSLDLVIHDDHLGDSSHQKTPTDKAYLQDMVVHPLIYVGCTVPEAIPSTTPKTTTRACAHLPSTTSLSWRPPRPRTHLYRLLSGGYGWSSTSSTSSILCHAVLLLLLIYNKIMFPLVSHLTIVMINTNPLPHMEIIKPKYIDSFCILNHILKPGPPT